VEQPADIQVVNAVLLEKEELWLEPTMLLLHCRLPRLEVKDLQNWKTI
jgi:hypothetical protein